jgi:hypothetical protein
MPFDILDIGNQVGMATITILAATDIAEVDQDVMNHRALVIAGTVDAAGTVRTPLRTVAINTGAPQAGMWWIVKNGVAQAITFKGTATLNADGTAATYTTGVAITASKHAILLWDGTDFVKIVELA